MKSLAILIALITLSIPALAEKNCQFRFDLENSVVEGTGFKFTKKTGVTGKFPKFTLNNEDAKKEIKDLLKGLIVTVDTMTVETNNNLRDQNLREAFFSVLADNAEAKVEVKKVLDKKIEALVHLNGQSKPVSFTYKVGKDSIEAEGSIDAMDFAMTDAMASLVKRCGSLHTDKDGKSKTWSDFKLHVKAALKKVCS
ncbi:MAG: YceI family protein [Bdellovibrionales bacterium]|nr:YceI family protein [Bdellovibrionales bacterium]